MDLDNFMLAHQERMRKIGEADINNVSNLATLHMLLCYRTGTGSLKSNERIDSLIEDMVRESHRDIPAISGSG